MLEERVEEEDSEEEAVSGSGTTMVVDITLVADEDQQNTLQMHPPALEEHRNVVEEVEVEEDTMSEDTIVAMIGTAVGDGTTGQIPRHTPDRTSLSHLRVPRHFLLPWTSTRPLHRQSAHLAIPRLPCHNHLRRTLHHHRLQHLRHPHQLNHQMRTKSQTLLSPLLRRLSAHWPKWPPTMRLRPRRLP